MCKTLSMHYSFQLTQHPNSICYRKHIQFSGIGPRM
jgi:hypothetical protein